MEKFYELSILAQESQKYKILKMLNIVFLVFMVMFMLVYPTLGLIIGLLLVLPTYLIKRVAFVEYDYEFNSGELTFSAIYEKKRRKEKGTIFLKEIELMAPINSQELDRYKNVKVIKCYNDLEKDKMLYSIVVKWETKMRAYHVMIDERMLDLCYFSNPHKVKKIMNR